MMSLGRFGNDLRARRNDLLSALEREYTDDKGSATRSAKTPHATLFPVYVPGFKRP